MALQISLSGEGLLDPHQLAAWSAQKQERLRQAVAQGMDSGGKRMAAAANRAAATALQIRRKNFPGFRHKVYADRKNDMPALRVYSRVSWLGIQERGGTIRGPLLIPLNQARRIGARAFRRIVSSLLRSGNAFFREVNGKVILFAENLAENRTELARFTRPLRAGLGGGRVKRGAEIPIAVLVPQVQIRARLKFAATIRAQLPQLVETIEQTIRTANP